MTDTLTDEDVTRLLTDLAESYDVPEHGAVLTALRELPVSPPVHKRRGVQLLTAAAVVTAAVVLGVTTTQGGTSGSSVLREGSLAVAAGTSESSVAAGQVGTGDTARPPDATALAPGSALSVQKDAGTGAGVVAPAPAPSQGRVVKSGQIALIVADGQVTTTLDAVQRAAIANGGLVFSSDTSESGTAPSGTITVRVPVAKFESLVLDVRALKGEVRTASTTASDVTAQYSDLATKIKTLNASRDRFLVILQDAKDIGSVLSVQQRIDTVTAQIDQLEGQRKVLAAQSDMSTLAVSVTEADDPVVSKQEQPKSGLSQAWSDAKHNFATGVQGLIRRSGRASLALICLVVLAGLGRVAWKVGRRRMV